MAAAACLHLPLSSSQLTACSCAGDPSGAHRMAGEEGPGHRGVCRAHDAMLRQAPGGGRGGGGMKRGRVLGGGIHSVRT